MNMVIASTSHARGQEGVQGRKRREIRKTEDKEELRRQLRTFPYGQWCWIRGKGEKMERGMGFPVVRRIEGTGG